MNKNIIFRVVAYTDAAGKYAIDAPRNGNEDNFYLAYDLSENGCPGEPDMDMRMSDCGLLMVVADGMGGMNAGEVASQIAVDTVAEFFAPGKISPDLANNHQSRKRYMENVIAESDQRIKKDSKHNNSHSGMGTTIIMAWIVGDELSLCWCGDSRAYRYNPATGIEPLSRDHSYVQELADKGIIRYEDTFDHPQGNIITRSLGDTSKKVLPESRLFKVHDKDLILLCSDGLSGVLRDKKSYTIDGELIEGDTIEDIIHDNLGSLTKCREALWEAAKNAEWYDNVTAILCEIRSGAGPFVPEETVTGVQQLEDQMDIPVDSKTGSIHIRLSKKGLMMLVAGIAILLCAAAFALWKTVSMLQQNKIEHNVTQQVDTTATISIDNSVHDDVDKTMDVDFVNEQAKLMQRIAELQNLLGLPSDVQFKGMKESVEKANNKQDLIAVTRKIELWDNKIPYIKKVKTAINRHSSEKDKLNELKSLLNQIYSSERIDSQVWNKKLLSILSSQAPKETIANPVQKSELTPIVDEQEKEYTVTPNDTYKSFIQNIERQNDGYNVSSIKTKSKGVKINENNFMFFRDADVDHSVVVLLKKK